MDNENRGLGAIFVRGGHVNIDHTLFAHLFLLRLKGGIIAQEDFAFGERHREFKVFAFRIPLVLEISIHVVIRANLVISIPAVAWFFPVIIGTSPHGGEQNNKSQGYITASPK